MTALMYKGTGRANGKRYWQCPVPGCGGLCDAEPRPGGGVWLGCNKCRERNGLVGGAWLVAVAQAETGDPKQAGNLLSAPESILGPPISELPEDYLPPQLPSSASIAGWQSRLWSEKEAVAWLLNERGLNEQTVRRSGLGWDGSLVIPCYDAHGKLANVVKRQDGKYKCWSGVKQRLYRPLPPKGSPWLLIEGLLDCLLARQEGIAEAITSTHGKGFPPRALPLVKGRRIAVAYDAEPKAERAARSRVEQLNAAGAVAWVVRLSKLDLPPKGDLTDALTGGYTAEDIRNFVNAEYRRQS
jgi:hypothetical protein